MATYLKWISIHAVALFSLLLIVSGCKHGKSENQKNAAPAGAKAPLAVSGFVLQGERLDNTVRATGTAMAYDEVELRAEASGRITKIYFTEGAHVSKGALLIKINDDDFQAQLKKNELQITLTEQQLRRQEQLLKIDATSHEAYDIAENALNTLKAEREMIQSGIDKTEIKAPFSGIIGLKYVSEGSYVSPASRIASVQNITPLKIDFSVPEKYADRISKGDTVYFSNDETAQSFKGNVYAIEPKIDLSTRTLQVRALCENKSEKIFPGSFLKISLQLKETKDALLVPTQALIPVLKGQIVYICKNGIAQSVPVKTGIRTDTKIQITDGLAAGDTVITSGIMSLKPNTPVAVTVK